MERRSCVARGFSRYFFDRHLKKGRQPRLWNDGFRGFCATAMRDLLIVKTKVKILCLAAALSFLAVAAPEPAAKRGAAFATVPKQALVELKATAGIEVRES